MGREVKRVPVDWDWPLEAIWEGYRNPHYVKCAVCEGRTDTPSAQWLHAISYIMAMLGETAAGVGGRGTHPWLQDFPLRPAQLPGDDLIPILRGLTRGKYQREDHIYTQMVHHIERAIVKAARVPKGWGVCPGCDGTGVDPAHLAAYEAWKPYDPPQGDGWQVWETVSEGSPITPAFATANELVDYLATQGTIWDQKRASDPRSFMRGGPWRREAAESFVNSGWAPSLVTFGASGEVYEGGRDADKIAPR